MMEMMETAACSELLMHCPKNEDFSEITVNLFNENEYRQHFRISRQVLTELAALLEQSEFYPSTDTGHQRISSEKCLQIFLWFAGHEAAAFRDVADRFNITCSKLHNIIENVSHFMSNMSSNIIRWPDEDERREILEGFELMGFPGVLGVMDGVHFQIDRPQEDPVSYLNRKKYYSLHMQAVCDHKKQFIDVFIGYPGSVHDARVFRNSALFATLAEKCGEQYILADSAYPCLRNLLTPYRHRENLTQIEKNYNRKLSHCRVNIEHTFGILKQRFRMLYHIKLKKIENICHFIRACCVLHNLAIKNEVTVLEDVPQPMPEEGINEEDDDEMEQPNAPGQAFRNYIAMMLNDA